MSRLATTAGGGAVGARCSHLLPSSEFPLLEEGEPPSGELTPRAVRNLPDPHALDTGALVGSPCSFVLLASDGMSGIRPAAPCSSPVPPHAGVDVAPNSLSSLLKTSLSSAPVLSAVPFILVGRAWRSCETPCGFESLHGLLPAKGCMPEARAGKAARSRSSSSARRRISAFACSSASVLPWAIELRALSSARARFASSVSRRSARRSAPSRRACSSTAERASACFAASVAAASARRLASAWMAAFRSAAASFFRAAAASSSAAARARRSAPSRRASSSACLRSLSCASANSFALLAAASACLASSSITALRPGVMYVANASRLGAERLGVSAAALAEWMAASSSADETRTPALATLEASGLAFPCVSARSLLASAARISGSDSHRSSTADLAAVAAL
mmetsp:Transcript_11457/g.35381  ORF Transcript_11457/g.35381 Transcript_11457/m.35381 type:complete len:398 (-) Transcript_11457:328-1521(-)